MRNAGSTRFVRNNRLKSRLEGRQVYSRLRAFHAQFPEVQAKNELSRTVPVRNARERPERHIARHSPRTRRKCGNIFVAICGRNVGWVPLRGTTRHSLAPLSDLRSRTFVPWHGVYDWKSCGAKDHAGIEPSGHPAQADDWEGDSCWKSCSRSNLFPKD